LTLPDKSGLSLPREPALFNTTKSTHLDIRTAFNRLGCGLQLFRQELAGAVNALLDSDGVGPSSDHLQGGGDTSFYLSGMLTCEMQLI
jgi:hypothetical protein